MRAGAARGAAVRLRESHVRMRTRARGEDPRKPWARYKALKEQKSGEVEWNFAKFLVGKNGEVVDRFKPGVKPEDPKITKKIEEELKK